jgi:hypothetical protein
VTVGFEGVAHRPSAVAARQTPPTPEQTLLEDPTPNDAQTPEEPRSADVASSERPVHERYSEQWTMR